jgi:RimJ/RimL family protein N-acetyltransferase
MLALVTALALAAPPVPATLQDAAFIAGSWLSDEGGVRSEEVWTAPAGDAMLGMWRVEVREEDGEVVDRCAGFAGIRPSRISRHPMLAAAVAPRWFGRGVATEACRLVLRDGFERCGYPRIVAGTDWNNAPSRALIRRLGFTPWRASPGFFGAVVWSALDRASHARASTTHSTNGP